jgi:hypothetical protein
VLDPICVRSALQITRILSFVVNNMYIQLSICKGLIASTIDGCERVQKKLVKYAPFDSWFMILTRKLLKLDFLASVNLILKYRHVPRCTENKGKAVPLNSKQALRGDRGVAVPSGRETRYLLYRRMRGRIWTIRKVSGQPGVQSPDRTAHTIVAIPTTVSVPSYMPTGRGVA